YRGAYTIHDMRVVKENGKVQEPLFEARSVDLSVAWDALLHGAFVGEIDVYDAKLNEVNGGNAATSQTGAETPASDWKKTVQDLFPIRIDRLSFHNSEIHYVDK